MWVCSNPKPKTSKRKSPTHQRLGRSYFFQMCFLPASLEIRTPRFYCFAPEVKLPKKCGTATLAVVGCRPKSPSRPNSCNNSHCVSGVKRSRLQSFANCASAAACSCMLTARNHAFVTWLIAKKTSWLSLGNLGN